MPASQGFWSYVHADDQAEGERISRLARDVSAQFEMLTGEPITLFLDKDAIRWGEDWRATIDTSLASVAFFIPVMTPRYFMSAECRREFQLPKRTFASRDGAMSHRAAERQGAQEVRAYRTCRCRRRALQEPLCCFRTPLRLFRPFHSEGGGVTDWRPRRRPLPRCRRPDGAPRGSTDRVAPPRVDPSRHVRGALRRPDRDPIWQRVWANRPTIKERRHGHRDGPRLRHHAGRRAGRQVPRELTQRISKEKSACVARTTCGV